MLKRLVASVFVVAGTVSLGPVGWRAQASSGPLDGLGPDVRLAVSERLDFVESDATLNLGRSNVFSLSAGDFTVHTWVRFADMVQPEEWGTVPCFGDPGCDMSILDKMASPNDVVNSNGWRLLKQSDNRFWFCLGVDGDNGCGGDASPTTVISQTVAQPDRWYSVAVTKTSTHLSIYVDGILERQTELGEYFDDNAADLLVGANDPQGALLYGWVGDVALFKRALNSGHVRALFETSKQEYQ